VSKGQGDGLFNEDGGRFNFENDGVGWDRFPFLDHLVHDEFDRFIDPLQGLLPTVSPSLSPFKRGAIGGESGPSVFKVVFFDNNPEHVALQSWSSCPSA